MVVWGSGCGRPRTALQGLFWVLILVRPSPGFSRSPLHGGVGRVWHDFLIIHRPTEGASGPEFPLERIAHAAFQLAQSRSKQLAIVHKANVLKMTTGLFRDVCKEVAWSGRAAGSAAG